ncbi:MAG: hypothetical protein AAFY71_11190 [Bacteroidota bacterium]
MDVFVNQGTKIMEVSDYNHFQDCDFFANFRTEENLHTSTLQILRNSGYRAFTNNQLLNNFNTYA